MGRLRYMRRLRLFRRSHLLRPDKISPSNHSAYHNHKRLSCHLPVYVRSVCLFHHSRISLFFLPDLWWMSGCLLSHKYNSLSYLLHWWRFDIKTARILPPAVHFFHIQLFCCWKHRCLQLASFSFRQLIRPGMILFHFYSYRHRSSIAVLVNALLHAFR